MLLAKKFRRKSRLTTIIPSYELQTEVSRIPSLPLNVYRKIANNEQSSNLFADRAPKLPRAWRSAATMGVNWWPTTSVPSPLLVLEILENAHTRQHTGNRVALLFLWDRYPRVSWHMSLPLSIVSRG